MAKLTIEERVNRGIALLDSKGPEGWRNRIDDATLDMPDYWNCVLGQVYDTFGRGLDALRIHTLAARHGFACYLSSGDSEYELLEAEWKRRLFDA